jgi:hypothetical protein
MTFDDNARCDADHTIGSRRSCRALINLPIALTTPSQEVLHASLTDISTGGCRVRSTYVAAPGRFVEIEIPDFASYSGWIAWGDGIEFGLDLSNPIPVDVVQHVLSLAQKRAKIDSAWFKALLSKSRPMYLSNHAKPRS